MRHILIQFEDGSRRRAGSYIEALEIVAERYPDADCDHAGDILDGGNWTACSDNAQDGEVVAWLFVRESPTSYTRSQPGDQCFPIKPGHPSFRALPTHDTK